VECVGQHEVSDDDVLKSAADRLEHQVHRGVEALIAGAGQQVGQAHGFMAELDPGGGCGVHVTGAVEYLVENVTHDEVGALHDAHIDFSLLWDGRADRNHDGAGREPLIEHDRCLAT
jgi:hypothetical protein